MGRNSLIGWMLAVCFIALIPTVGATQTAVVKSLMAVLRADSEALGAPKVLKVSADTVDPVVKMLGGEASLFVKSGDQYVRVATTLVPASLGLS